MTRPGGWAPLLAGHEPVVNCASGLLAWQLGWSLTKRWIIVSLAVLVVAGLCLLLSPRCWVSSGSCSRGPASGEPASGEKPSSPYLMA